MLAEARAGNLTYERVRDLTAANPARIFDIPRKGRIEEGADADLVLVDPAMTHPIRGEGLHTACDWTPFEGWAGVFPELTMVRGTVIYERDPEDRPGGDSERFAEPVGENVRTASRTDRPTDARGSGPAGRGAAGTGESETATDPAGEDGATDGADNAIDRAIRELAENDLVSDDDRV